MRADVRAGCVALNSTAMGPPSEKPKSAARSEPTASITARTSSIRSSSVGRSWTLTRSDSPVPRLSKRISRLKEARRRKKRAPERLLPADLEVRHPTRDEHEVQPALSQNLVGDVEVAALHVPGHG